MLGKLAQACREGSLQDHTHQARRQDYKSLSNFQIYYPEMRQLRVLLL